MRRRQRCPRRSRGAIDGSIAAGGGGGIAGTAVASGAPVVSCSIARDPRWARLAPLALANGVRAAWSHPIRAIDGAVLGTLDSYFAEEREPHGGEQRLVARAAQLAALVIERFQAVTVRRERDQEIRLLVDAAPDVIARFDRNGRHLFVSPAVEVLTGVPPEAFVGRTHHEFAAERGVPEPYASRWHGALRRVLTTGSVETIEFDFPCAEGEGYFECRIAPVLGADGEPDGAISVGRDITALRRAERALVARERHYRAMIERTTDLITILDPAGLIRFQNDAVEEVIGYTAPELVGRSVFELIHPDDRAAAAAELQRLFDAPASAEAVEFRVRHRDGSWRYLQAKGQPLVADAPEEGMVVNSRDLTTRREAELALRRRDAALQAVSEAAECLLRSSDWTEQMPRVLQRLGEAVDAERVWLVDNRTDAAGRLRITKRFVWSHADADEAVASIGLDDADIADLGLGRWSEALSAGTPICAATAELPPAERVVMERFGVEAFAVIPIRAGEEWWGSVGFNCARAARRWSASEIDVLRTAGELLGAAIHRQRIEEARRETELQFRTLFEQAADAIAIHDVDGRFIEVNDRLCTLLGYDRAALLAMSATDVEAHLPYDGPTIGDGDGERPGAATREGAARRRDGVGIPIQVRRSHIEFGGRRLVLGIIRDVSEQKRAEQALRDSEAWFRSLTQHALDVVTVLGSGGEIRYTSPSGCRLLGYDEAELLGRDILELVHPDDAGPAREVLRAARDSGEPTFTFEARVRTSDGRWQAHEAVGTSLEHDPAIRGIVLNSRDVTARLQLEAQLRQAQKMEAVGKLAGGIAHDFNNLLTAIKGHAQFALEIMAPDEPTRVDVEEIDRAAGRAADLTRQLLAFSRKQVLQPKVVSLNDLVGGMSRMLRRIIGEDVELVTDLLPGIGPVAIDPGQFEQVVMNLAVNGRDAMPHGGKLVLRTRALNIEYEQRRDRYVIPPNRYVLLTVQDTGTGIDAETMPQIFEPFFTTKDVGRGTGLGLSTVYGIVKQSGGFVEVRTTVGEGTSFVIYLPEAAAPAPEPEAVEEAEPRPGSGTILLVEDEPSVRQLARAILERGGYTILEAAGPEEALRVAGGDTAIDLLLTDVVMPGMSGQLLAERLLDTRAGTPVLFMSGYNEDAIALQGVLRGGAALLAKPFTPAELLGSVARALGSASDPAREPAAR